MLHFIPAWYKQNEWSENEQYWYRRRMRTEFDDTVKQIQLFHRREVYPYQITLLSFTPNFRHFLHRQGVYHAPYWSCFDAIQEVRRKKAMLLSYHNLKWPEGIEFVYSPFVVIAMLNGRRYAQVEFGEDGNPIQIDMYQNGVIGRRNIYDDRGFVSSTIVYREGRPYYQDYLNEQGIWKIRCFLNDGHVEINPQKATYLLTYKENEKSYNFSQLRYENIEQVIYEVVRQYVETTDEEDIFCMAMHAQHTELLEKALYDRKKIVSFYENRFPDVEFQKNQEFMESADYIICDSEENVYKVKRISDHIQNVTDITPYDTRQDVGISQQLKVQKILFPVDGLDDTTLCNVIAIFRRYLDENEHAEIHLFTRQATYDCPKKLLEKTREYLRKNGFNEAMALEEKNRNVAENHLEEEEAIPVRFFVEQCVDELTVSKCMREQRLIVDLREQLDLYLQVNAVSFGIPQIALKGNNFLKNRRNGIVLSKIQELPHAMNYYLERLSNWNHASLQSYEISKQYSTPVLIEKWKEVIESVGNN